MYCKDCRWFSKSPQFQYGKCHLHPPTVGWPAVKDDDFCSHFDPKQKNCWNVTTTLDAQAPQDPAADHPQG